VLYYLAPFFLSVMLLTLREVILGARMKRLRALVPPHEAKSAPEGAQLQSAHLKEHGGSGA
jgi:hypothetical protein